MLSIVLGAVALAGVVVLAAQCARERRALRADVHALRLELRRVREALAAGRVEAVPRSSCGVPARTTGPGSGDELDADARGSRTLH